MYQIIDDNQTNFNSDKITPDMLGLKATTDFAEYANQVICDEVPDKAQKWSEMGGIDALEAGEMFAEEFNGTYNNVLTNEMQRDNYLANHPKVIERSEKIDERIAKQQERIAERNKRVNEGTASFGERVSAFLDRWGEASYQAQVQTAQMNEDRQKPHKGDSNYRYKINSVDRAGNIIYDEYDLTKKIGFAEGLRNSLESGYSIPFAGGHIKRAVNKKIDSIRDKIVNGEQITQQELEYFNRYRERQYEKQVRGYSIGGTIGENWLPSTLAFGAEMYLGGAAVKALGLAGKGQAVGSAVTAGLSNVNKLGKAGEAIAKGTGFVTGELLEGGLNAAVGASIAGTAGGEFWASYNERRLNDKMKITDRGTVIFTEAQETPAKAFLKSMQAVYLSFFTENMGKLIGAGLIKPAGKLAKLPFTNPISKKIAGTGAEQFARVLEHCPKLAGFVNKSSQLLSKTYEKLNNLPIKGKSAEWLKSSVKFDGFLEELGEEVLEDVLNLSLGTYNEERNLRNYINAVFKSPDEWAVLMGLIALQGTSLSLAGNLLGDAMQRNGIPAEQIMEVLQNSTEAEKIELNDGLIDNSTIQVGDITSEEKARKQEIENYINEQLVGAGAAEQEANDMAILAGSMFEKYGVKNAESRKVFDDFINNLKVKYNIPVDKINGPLFQSAMKRSQFTNFDDFYNNVLSNVNSKIKKQWNEQTADGLNIRIPHDTIIHDENNHKLSNDEWKELFDNIDNVSVAGISKQSSSYNGKSVLLKIITPNNIYGVVIELFKKSNPIISTAFIDTEPNIDNWIKNEAVSSGTKTTFSNISLTNIIKDIYPNFKSKKIENGILFQDADDEKTIAGYTYQEVMDKLIELGEEIDKLGNSSEEKEFANKLMAKIHVLEDAFDVSENPEKYSNENKRHEIMLNAYYIMNNQEIPQEYIEEDSKSQRTYKELKEIHDKKKEAKEDSYRGYYYRDEQKKPIITIMANKNGSTALHEFGHLFLDLLNELAKVNADAQEQLDAVNKWLGANGEYTRAQQEKFANNFVAYLYKGKAPNSKLKQVFENFKNWLQSVYESILDIPDVDISDEVQEMFDNIFASDSYYQERKQASELLKQVKAKSKKEKFSTVELRDDDALDETEKRHKEISYDILSVATGKSKTYLKTIFETGSNKMSFGKKREKIEELIGNVADPFSGGNGFLPEWGEFYSDTGVSYGNEELGGDYILAEQALDTILNKAYRNPEKNVNNIYEERMAYFANAIDTADRQYKLLLSKYKNGNRNVALAAIYEWIDELNPEIKQDYEDRFIYDSGIIDRNEHVDKFDKAKRQIISKAMELENRFGINKNEKYQEIVKEIMRNLDFLQPNDKAKLTANILDVPSVDFLMSSIDNIMDIAKTMEDVNLRTNLEREIHKELQGTKNVKKNGRTVGKYDYRTNKLFEELRILDRLSAEQADEMRHELGKFVTAEENGLSFKDKLVNKFLSYKANGRTFADTELMKDLYDEIVKIKLVGKSAKSELELQEKLDETKDIDELIKIVQSKKDAGFIVKNYIDKVANLESTLNAIFNKDIKDRYGAEILYSETQAQAWQHEQKTKFEKEVAKIYNLPQWCWDKKIIEYLGEKHTYSEIRRKYDKDGELIKTRNVDRTLTKMDLIQAYIWSKNEVLEKRLINQFGQDTLDAMFDELTLQDVKLAELMMHTAQSFYPLVNKAFINKYGLDLPKVSCYFPSTPERGSEVDLYNDYSSKSLNNSFTKARASSETQAMDFHNPLATLYSHIEGVAKFAFMSDSLDKANLRFKDLDLKRVIINKYGEDAYRTLEQSLINITYKKESPVFNGMNKIIDNMVGNWIQANIAIKPIVGLKQLLSANNYAVDMPYMTWQAGFLKAIAHPKETIDYMMNIPYIKARYEGSYSNEFLKQTIENSAFATSKKLKDLCNVFIKMGDIGAIMFGGKPYIEYLIKEKGMSEQEAIKQFILSTNRSQQSSAVSSLSNFQVAMTRNPMGKLFIAFKNAPQQYIRMCGDAIVSVANGDMSKQQCARLLFQYGYLQPFFYAVATSGSLLRFIFTGDDDDFLKDASISIFNLGSDALPIIGDIYKYAINKMLYKEKFLPQNTPLLGDIQAELNKISKEDVSVADYLDAIGYLGLHVGLGYNSKAITNMGSGVGDMATGEFGQGAMKVLGYTEKRAKHITKK